MVDLGEENALSTFLFSYVCRDNNNKDNPKEMDILGSNTFDGKNYDESQTTLLASLSNLPNTKAASYESDIIKAGASYRYLWFKVKSSTSGSNWIALTEAENRKRPNLFRNSFGAYSFTESVCVL